MSKKAKVCIIVPYIFRVPDMEVKVNSWMESTCDILDSVNFSTSLGSFGLCTCNIIHSSISPSPVSTSQQPSPRRMQKTISFFHSAKELMQTNQIVNYHPFRLSVWFIFWVLLERTHSIIPVHNGHSK